MNIYSPHNNKAYSIFSKQGLFILKKYLQNFIGGASSVVVQRSFYFINNSGQWIPFTKDINSMLLKQYDSFSKSTLNLGAHTIFFNEMKQMNNSTRTKRDIRQNKYTGEWEFRKNDGSFQKYSAFDSRRINNAYLKKVYFTFRGFNYQIDFKSMMQTNLDTGVQRPIKLDSKNTQKPFSMPKKPHPIPKANPLLLPIRGKGKYLDNNGFHLLQVTELTFPHGTVNVDDDYNYKQLVKLAKQTSKIFKHSAHKFEEPVSYGAGPHISLSRAPKVKKDFYEFEIHSSAPHEYGDGRGGGYITLRIKKKGEFSHNGNLSPNPAGQPHITIARLR